MRRVFFSFSWSDVIRVMQIRNSGVTKGGVYEARFADAAEIEEVKKKSRIGIKRWIDEQMDGTSVTCVLISMNTSKSDWVAYEIAQSINQDKGLFGVYIHNAPDMSGNRGIKGANPLPRGYPTYDWEYANGRENLPDWIEAAARMVGK